MNKRHYEHTLPNIRGSLSNTYITSCVITLHRRPEKTERKRQEREKKRKAAKEREKAGTGRTDKGMAVRTAAQKKRKNCNYAELGASCFCPP